MKSFVKKTFYVNKNNVIIACRFKVFKVSVYGLNRFYIQIGVVYADGTESEMRNNLEFGTINDESFRLRLFETKEDAVRNENKVIAISYTTQFGKGIMDYIVDSFREVACENMKWAWDGVKAVPTHVCSVDFVSGKINYDTPPNTKSWVYATKEECESKNSIQYIDFPQEVDEDTEKAIEETEQKISELQEKLSALKEIQDRKLR